MFSCTGNKLPKELGFALAGLIGVGSAAAPATMVYAGGHKQMSEEARTIPVQRETKLYVKNSRGKTIVVGKRGAQAVTIRAEKYVRAKNEESASEWMEQLTFQSQSDGDQVSIIAHYPSGAEESFWAFLSGMRYKALIEFTIEVPSGFDVEVSSGSGDVQVTSIEGGCGVYGSSGDVFLKSVGGGVFVEVSSGDVEVVEVAGDVRILSSSGDATIRGAGRSVHLVASSGDMEAHQVNGDATVELDSGDFVIRGCKGNVESHTASGNATMKGVLGSVRAIASSGDVSLDVFPVGDKEFLVNTASGDVNVMFATPANYGFMLDVSTASGSIEGDLDIRLDKVSRRVLRGVVGSGQGRMTIETASGNIVIYQSSSNKKTK